MTEPTGPQVVYRSTPEDLARGQLALLEDQELVRLTLEGHDAAYEALMQRYSPLVIGTLHRKLNGRAEAEDLAQEVFLAAWRGLGRLRSGERFRFWLMRILRSKLIDAYRHAGRQPRFVDHETPEDPDRPSLLDRARDPAAGPAERLGMAETRDVVLREIDRLGEKYRSVLYLRLIGEQSAEEIARHLGTKPGSIRMRLFRGMRMLRKTLTKLGFAMD